MKLNPKFYTPVKVKKTYQTIEVEEGDKIVTKTYLVQTDIVNHIQKLEAELNFKKPSSGETIITETFWVGMVDSDGQHHSSLVNKNTYNYIDMIESKLLELGFDVNYWKKPPPHDKEKAKKIKDYYEKMAKVDEWKEEQEKLKK
jgi:hypothetical protein